MSMTDRELLELAARAAGYDVKYGPSGYPYFQAGLDTKQWNPLNDDGEALRLAAAVPDITIVIDNHMKWCGVYLTAERGKYDLVEYFNGDKAYSIRLAITRAAAEIGKIMKAGD